MPRLHPNTILGALALAFGLVLAFVWVPLDAENGIVYTRRGRYNIGDGLAPTVAAVFFLVPGLMLIFGRKAPDAPRLGRSDVIFLMAVLSATAIGLLVMRYAGPLAAIAEEGGYRALRATVPWKYIGFLLGGPIIVGGLISFVEGRATLRAALIGLTAALVILLLYDVPFEDLLLPPNGDV